jgi:hypothetical protein
MDRYLSLPLDRIEHRLALIVLHFALSHWRYSLASNQGLRYHGARLLSCGPPGLLPEPFSFLVNHSSYSEIWIWPQMGGPFDEALRQASSYASSSLTSK